MEPDTPDNKKDAFNLKDILLPQKEGRTSASAERVNAGVLLEGEQAATLVTEPENTPAPRTAVPQTPTERESAPIASLQTYKSDIESVIEQKNVSAISIAAAEAERGGRGTGLQAGAQQRPSWIKNATFLVGSIALVLGAIGGLAYVFLRPAPSVPQQISASTPFIAVDDTQVLLVPALQWNRNTVMQGLTSLREKTSISLGLISRSYAAIATSTTSGKDAVPQAVSIQELLEVIAPNAPSGLLRALVPTTYLLGVHMYDGTQPFLIMQADSYEQAFSGMLEWEDTIHTELLPLFEHTPSPTINNQMIATSTATTSAFLPSTFRDRVVENHDARVLQNEVGEILLLWTFLDRSTLVITTSEVTLREIISRRSSFAPAQ